MAKEFEVHFNCLRDNTQKYKTYSVPITKEVKRIGKNEGRNHKDRTLQIAIS